MMVVFVAFGVVLVEMTVVQFLVVWMVVGSVVLLERVLMLNTTLGFCMVVGGVLI